MKKSITTLCLLLLSVFAAETATLAQRRASERSTGAAAGSETEKAELEAALAAKAPAERLQKLKDFIEAHPRSALRARATEHITSARAALGDERLQAGDAQGGIEQFRLAISESPASMSEKLFAEVVSQIPVNLFVRGERAAALEAARLIETKVASDARRLLAVASFYLRIEDTDEAARIAEAAIKLAPEMAEAHQALGAARHVALRLDDAITEYRRALELNPKLGGARRSLADLYRAQGKAEEALALYREELTATPKEKTARAGLILSLFDLGRREEAERELESALKDEPRSLALLVGASYWYAAHKEPGRALELARRAVEIEPRYTWAQIALARALVANGQPLEAERALRFARQYGRFPTLDYEFASALAAAGLYDEAAEQLARSFTIRDGQIETQLAGRQRARAASFIELLAPERRASIFQNAPADDEANARTLKGLLALTAATRQWSPEQPRREAEPLALAIKDFTEGTDAMRAYRQLYAASRLLRSGGSLPLVLELTEAATTGVEAALDMPVAAVAIQAEELGPLYARAVASGTGLATTMTPRNVLSNIMRGRIEDLRGWALFNQEKAAEAVPHLRRAASVMPENTPWWRTAQWHLGAALEASGNHQEALAAYIKSYKAGPPDPARRVVIEALYRKLNGSLQGLDERIGAATPVATIASNNAAAVEPTPTSTAAPATESATTETKRTETTSPVATENRTAPPVESTAAATASPSPTPELTTTPTPEPTPTPTPAPTPEPQPTPSPTPVPTPEPTPVATTEPPPTPTTPQPTPTPTPSSSPQPPPTPTPTPTSAPEPSSAPTSGPTSEPTATPTPTPTPSPTPELPSAPTPTPSSSPQPPPTPTPTPSPAATAPPTPAPTPTSESRAGTAPTRTPTTPERSRGRRRNERKPAASECIFSLSEKSLTIRPHGSAIVSVTLEGLNSSGDIQPISSDWSNIAVFPEPAAGATFRYTITSISKQTGTYSITFKSPCGLKNLEVKVK